MDLISKLTKTVTENNTILCTQGTSILCATSLHPYSQKLSYLWLSNQCQSKSHYNSYKCTNWPPNCVEMKTTFMQTPLAGRKQLANAKNYCTGYDEWTNGWTKLGQRTNYIEGDVSNPTIGHWRNADLTLQELHPSHSDRLIKWQNKTAETIFRSEENRRSALMRWAKSWSRSYRNFRCSKDEDWEVLDMSLPLSRNLEELDAWPVDSIDRH